MRCDKCRDDAVYFQAYSGRCLCSRHLVLDIENRAKHSIRSHRWMSPGDHIAVHISGDRKSAALLFFLKKLTADRRDIRLSAVPACRGSGMEGRPSAAITVAESLRIPWSEMPHPGGTGTAAQEKVTKVALAISLDDIAQGILGEILFGNAGRLVHPRPSGSSLATVICPFITVPSDELNLYWDCQGTGIDLVSSTPHRKGLLKDTAAFLEEYSHRHPATKFALLHLWEQISNGNTAALPFTDTEGTGSGEGAAGINRCCGDEVTGRGS
jgi:tRNA(Ile)-lysidine synthase TilS/MesJ